MRAHGDGGIERRGKTSWRLRYRIGKVRYEKTFSGTLKEAKTELRKLLRSGDTGEHVAPDNATLAVWAKQWIEAGAPGRKRQAVGARAIENYDQLLRSHVLPVLGEHKLQQIDSTDIDKLYLSLEGKIAPRTARHVHSVFNACLGAAVRTRKLAMRSTQWRAPPRCPPPAKAITELRSMRNSCANWCRASRDRRYTQSSALPRSLVRDRARYWPSLE